ncbi:MAG: DegT/DnrJ/EryC1/StrS family aminotransferase [Gammaproteobacteria bacterium]|nr:DegT/DnrJ/EryC1/StrS family aminotransferase [Gammaproteobacteria bacterium]
MAKHRQPDQFIVFGAPDIQQPEIDEVVDSLKAGWLGTGPKVQKFERDFAAYKGVDSTCAAALNSCTAALHVSLIAAGIKPGDEVITTAMTFCATANAAIHAGATPVPVDIEPATLNIDPALIEQKITDRTRAIVPVHFAGRPCEMDAIMKIAKKYDLLVIEDCAHAIETEFRGQKAGTFGEFGCFSFYATKNVATGEGGMVIAKSPDAIDRIKILSLHGMSRDAWHRFGDSGYKHYYVVEAGFKYNMMDLQAAIGIHQLSRVERSWLRRQEIWARYQREFSNLPIGLPTEPAEETRHAYHLYTVNIEKERCGIERDEFISKMSASKVGVGVHYQSLAQHPYYTDRFGWQPSDFPCADKFGRSTVSLPISPKLTDDDVNYIIETVIATVTS